MGEGKRRVCVVDNGGSQQRSRPNYCLRCLGLRSKPHGVAGLAKKYVTLICAAQTKLLNIKTIKVHNFVVCHFSFTGVLIQVAE